MNVALDIGCHELRALRFERGQLRARRCRSLVLLLENTETQRSTLDQLNIVYTSFGDRLALFGEPAERIAMMFHRSPITLLPDGRLPDGEFSTRLMMSTVIESLIGRAAKPGDFCAVTVPGVIKSGSSLEAEEKRFFLQTVKRLGYTPLVIGAPQCLVLAELADSQFTGIAATFGAATSELSLAFHGREIARCVNPNAGAWIDQRLARLNDQYQWDANGQRYVDAERTRGWKERFGGSLMQPLDESSQQLSDVCRGVIEHLFRQAAESFKKAADMQGIAEAIPLVVGGGSARFQGFAELVQQTIDDGIFPVPVSGVRVATQSDFTVARGALIQAELEGPATTSDDRVSAA